MSARILDVAIGVDPRETLGFEVFRHSLVRRCSKPTHITPILLASLRYGGLYTRKHERHAGGQLWDVISGAPMSTEFAISRFLVPHVMRTGWALFGEPDMLAMGDIAELFALTDDRYAVMCVKHDQKVAPGERKMDGRAQVPYARKNWSSLCLWNCDHPAHRALTLEVINTAPGRDLHRFHWLKDEEIGALPREWNHLVGIDADPAAAKILHFTKGTPETSDLRDLPLARLWEQEAELLRRRRPSEWERAG